MGTSSSKVIVNDQRFVIRTKAYAVRNGKNAPIMDKEARKEIYMYLHSDMFRQRVQNDLDSYFDMKKNRVVQIVVSSVSVSEYLNIVTIKGILRVVKPLTSAFSISRIKSVLHGLIPHSSKNRNYPTRTFGHYLGSETGRISLRFYGMTTMVNL